MNNLKKAKRILSTRMGSAIISMVLCITLTGSLICLPTFAVPETGAQSTPKSSGTELFAGDKEVLSPVGDCGVLVERDGSTNFVFVRDLTDTSAGYLKTCFKNRDAQIKILRNGVELTDTELVGTGCTVECVSSIDSSVVYETAQAVVFGDVDGDGDIDEDDYNAILDKAVMGIDGLITDGSAYYKAADCREDGVIDGFDLSVADLVISQNKSYIDFEKVNYNEFETVFEHTDEFLYRVGNGNTVKLGSLFEVETAGDAAVASADVNIGVYSVDGNTSVCGTVSNSYLLSDSTAKCVYSKDSSDWTKSTLKFTGEGPVVLTIADGDGRVCYLNLEIVNANNTTAAASASSTNIVLLNDIVASGRYTISNSKTLYGNGFSMTDTRPSDSTKTNQGFITISNGRLDNVNVIGQEYPTAVMSGVNNEYYSPCIQVTGSAEIYNSHISGCKHALLISGTNPSVYAENSAFTGGALSSIKIEAGVATLKNCITSLTTDPNGLKGLGIMLSSAATKINLSGTFTQYNWVKKTDLPSDYQNALSSIFSDSTYAYNYNGSVYVNAGILFMSESTNITSSMAQEMVNDQTNGNFGFPEKTMFGHTGTLMALKAASANDSLMGAHDFELPGQYSTLPYFSFDYTTKNYVPMSANNNNYCYYDTAFNGVNISFDKADDTSYFSWDTDILTVTKYGQQITSTVTMNGVDYTGKSIHFTESGEYDVVYSYTDMRHYDKDLNASSRTYTQTVHIKVTAVEPEDNTYYADFSYVGNWANNVKKVVINNKIYIMPDVTSTSTYITSVSVGGQTVYCPKVDATGNSTISGPECYCPAFKAINITDYNQETGAVLYTYNSSTQKWPHNQSGSSGPDTSVYGYGSVVPFDGSSGASGRHYTYDSSYGGLCFKSGPFSRDIQAQTRNVEFYYVSTDGNTYYYYISYSIPQVKQGSCVAEGTLVTMADGTKKPIEQVNQGDMVMTWSLWNGCYEAQPVAIKWHHDGNIWKVLTLNFSDGTDVRMINDHGFFDVDENKFVYITPENVDNYIGHKFIKQTADGNTTVVLTDYSIAEENVGCYSILTANNYSFIVDDMLSMTGEEKYKGRFDFFTVGEGMKYDEELMQADIARYGLYTLDDFDGYLTSEQFEGLKVAYYKVLVGKGVFSYDDILGIIKDNL